jgi:fused signal recognition particle receptor
MGLFDFFKKKDKEKEERLEVGLEKTKVGLLSRINRLIRGKKTVDDEVLDELEEILVSADVGVETTVKIIDRIRARVARDKYVSTDELDDLLRDEISLLFAESKTSFDPDSLTSFQTFTADGKKVPYVLMVVGVNGVGKTTTIGKLAFQFKEAGNKVLLGAADTFRAAAVEQLKVWAQRVNVDIVEKGMGVDPGSVAFEAAKVGTEGGYDVVIIDTAGRLHNKKNLMNELAKIKRTIQKFVPEAPHEVLLVLDASTGQNAIQQAAEFMEFTEVTALALTKLDGTAKGGVVIGISDRFKIPVKYIGVGEKMIDLQLFDPKSFVQSLFKKTASDQQ